jgi:hypothetical protein
MMGWMMMTRMLQSSPAAVTAGYRVSHHAAIQGGQTEVAQEEVEAQVEAGLNPGRTAATGPEQAAGMAAEETAAAEVVEEAVEEGRGQQEEGDHLRQARWQQHQGARQQVKVLM